MQLVTRFSRLFATGAHKTWSQAQPIFKDYYSRRLTLAPKQLENFLLRLSTKRFSESDHRWLSLLQNIQGNLGKFKLQSRVGMLKALSTMGSKAELSSKLLQNVMGELKELTFQEAALLLWCLSKNSSRSRMEDATKIYQHICAILEKHEKDGQMSIIIRKEETNEFERNTLALKATSICMVLSGMAKLGISEKTILKHLLRSGVKPNIPAFSVNGLVSLLISLQKLGLRNKRDSLNIYLQIRKRAEQLQVGPLETIQNLVPTVANLAYSTHFEEIEVDGRQKPKETIEKLREIRAGINKFVLWLCETVQLRQKHNHSKQLSAKLLGSCGKVMAFDEAIWSNFLKGICTNIQDCKIIDLVMSLKAITRLTGEQRKLLAKEEQQICTRLWALYQSVTGKSLTVLALLHDAKKVSPPPKMSAILTAHMAKLRTMVLKSRTEREGGEQQAEDQQLREKI